MGRRPVHLMLIMLIVLIIMASPRTVLMQCINVLNHRNEHHTRYTRQPHAHTQGEEQHRVLADDDLAGPRLPDGRQLHADVDGLPLDQAR